MFFLNHQILLMIHKSHLRFDHPELDQMAPGFRLFRAESGPKGINPARAIAAASIYSCPLWGKEGVFIKIFGVKEVRRSFTGRRSQRWRIHQGEALPSRPVPNRLNDLGPNAKNRPLPW